MRENPWSQRNPSFEVERRVYWLAARFELTTFLFSSLDGVNGFSAEIVYRKTRRLLSDQESRELVFLEPDLRVFQAQDFLRALEYEDRSPSGWLSTFEKSLLSFEQKLLAELESRFSWEDLAGPIRSHAHRFGTSQAPASLLNSTTDLPALLCHFQSPVATPIGSSLFLWERLTAHDVRFTDRSTEPPVLRKIRSLWLEALARAVFPGCEVSVIDESERFRFRISIRKKIARNQIHPSPETVTR